MKTVGSRDTNIGTTITRRTLLAGVLLCMYISLSFAVDGQINVLPDGTTPFVISSPGSYVLVSGVDMTASTDCIQITTSNVTLDLNGHTLTGTGTGHSSGIVQASGVAATVFNGAITQFGRYGISLGERSRVTDLTVSVCGNDSGVYYAAVQLADYCVASRVTATANHGDGIYAGTSCLIEHCVVRENGTQNHAGISVASGSTVRGCVVSSNGHNLSVDSTGTGILGRSDGVTVTNNTCQFNSGYGANGYGYGIRLLGYGHIVMYNTCRENNGTGIGRGYGIIVYGGDSTISHNLCQNNTGNGEGSVGIGIRVSEGSNISNNTCSFNFGDHAAGEGSSGVGILLAGSGNRVVNNTCAANTGNGSKGFSYGIWLSVDSDRNRIENNMLAEQATGAFGKNYGLMVEGDRNHIISNILSGNASGSINLTGNSNYYAANIYPAHEAINDSGTGNVAGAMPGVNVSVP